MGFDSANMVQISAWSLAGKYCINLICVLLPK